MGNFQNRARKNKRNARNWRQIIQMRLVRAVGQITPNWLQFSCDHILENQKNLLAFLKEMKKLNQQKTRLEVRKTF